MRKRLSPRFLIIGPPRTGTTSVFRSLLHHRRVVAPAAKEVYFFASPFPCTKNYSRGIGWYLAQFPWDHGDGKVTFEASTNYFHSTRAASRVKDFDPSILLIAILRDPVQRFWSHYRHSFLYHRIVSDASRLARANEGRLTKIDESFRGDPRSFDRVIDELIVRNEVQGVFRQPWLDYAGIGIYENHLRRWRSYFSGEQLLVLKSEDLFENYEGILAEVQEFLGIGVENLPRFKASSNERNARLADEEDRKLPERYAEILRDFYRPANARLNAYLGRNLGWDS